MSPTSPSFPNGAPCRSEAEVNAKRIAENDARMAWRAAHPDTAHEARKRAAREGRDI